MTQEQPQADTSGDAARLLRVTGNVNRATERENWLVAAFHVGDDGKVHALIDWRNFSDGDMAEAHRMLREELAKSIRERAAEPAK